MSGIETASLRALLSEDADAADRRAAMMVARELPSGSGTLVLCGAGYFGRLLLEGLKANGVLPLAFADNNRALQGKQLDGIQVLSVEQAVRDLPHASFVVTVFNPSGLAAQLQSLGVVPASVRALMYANAATLLPQSAMNLPSAVINHAEEVLAASELWADDESRAEYEHLIRWHLLLDPPDRPAGPISDTYFPPGIVELGDRERFADCGAFDGDSLKEFLLRTDGSFERIDALEPDPDNVEKLQSFVSSLPSKLRERVHIHPFAVGATNATLRFQAGLGLASTITERGNYSVRCVPLDKLLADAPPTFIKMDVEGAEPDVIQGAERLISAHAPTMAIVLYHRTSDMWTIPLSLRRLRPDYDLYLRRYAEDCWESVCYAVRRGS
jgi:FkbM family methyltransferase